MYACLKSRTQEYGRVAVYHTTTNSTCVVMKMQQQSKYVLTIESINREMHVFEMKVVDCSQDNNHCWHYNHCRAMRSTSKNCYFV